MAKRPRRLAKNKTALMPKNASYKRWDTLEKIARALSDIQTELNRIAQAEQQSMKR